MKLETWHLSSIEDVSTPAEVVDRAADDLLPGSVFTMWDCENHGGHAIFLTAEHLSDLQDEGTPSQMLAILNENFPVFQRLLD